MTKQNQKRLLQKKIRDLLFRNELKSSEQESIAAVPPYNQYVATLHYRFKVLRVGSIAGFFLLALVIGQQIYEKHQLSEKLDSKDAYLIPANIPDVIRVRANSLSDNLVYEFAEWFASELGNINYGMAEQKIKSLAKYLSPQLKSRFLRQMEQKVELWKARRVDQQFSFEPVKTFQRKTNGRETRFQVEIWGTVRKYVEGREQPPYQERISLSFRTAPVDSEKTWLFEVVAIDRKTPKEIEDSKVLNQKE